MVSTKFQLWFLVVFVSPAKPFCRFEQRLVPSHAKDFSWYTVTFDGPAYTRRSILNLDEASMASPGKHRSRGWRGARGCLRSTFPILPA